MTALELLRAFVRYKTHGGYRWAAVLSDGTLLCEPCAKENYRQIYRATKAGDARTYDQWECIGLTNSGESEETEFCVHCNKLLWEKQT